MIHMTSGYSLETYGAQIALEKSKNLMANAIQKLPDEPLQLIDYGMADGGTALDFFRDIMQDIRTKNNHPLCFIGNDLPTNPHNDLALNLNKLQKTIPGLQVFISPTSFYEQVVGNRSVDLAFSATAMHWLSQIPAHLTTHIHANSARDAERYRYRQQALDDFELLMMQRAKELKKGAQMVLVNLAEANDGQSLGKNFQDFSMFDYLQSLFRKTLSEHNISEDLILDTNFQNFYKRKEDFEEVFMRESLASQFRVLEHRIEHTPCPYRAQFDEDQDVERFADGLMKTIRSWSRHTFLRALQMHDQDLAIADAFYDNLRQTFAENPSRYSMDYIHSFIHIEKV
jgi:hypothetical protein